MNWLKTKWDAFRQSAVCECWMCWIMLPHNIMLLRRDAARLEEMKKKNPGQGSYWLPPE